jgi:hypothetical protein
MRAASRALWGDTTGRVERSWGFPNPFPKRRFSLLQGEAPGALMVVST